MSPSQDVHSKALGIFREEVRAINTVAGLTPNFICYPIHANTIAAMSRRGGNALGIETTGEPLISKFGYPYADVLTIADADLVVCFVSTSWTEAQDDSAVWDMTRNTVSRVKSLAREYNVSSDFTYMNYAWTGEADEVFAG